MRNDHHTLKASGVHARCRRMLVEHLRIHDFKRSVPAGTLADLLLLAGCTRGSVSSACRRLPGGPSASSARSALLAALPRSSKDLLARLLAALHASLPGWLRGAQAVAIDLHQVPFHGRGNAKGVTRRQEKQSTRKSFTYATLSVISPEGRWAIGLVPTYPAMRLHTLASRLLGQARQAGIDVAYLMADKEFCSAEVVRLLRRRGTAFLMPLPIRGRKKGVGSRRFLEEGTPLGWHSHRWEAALRKRRQQGKGQQDRRVKKGRLQAEVDVCVARGKGGKGKEGKEGKQQRLVYACWGLRAWSPAQVREAYRKRFGIESGYRQLGQCRGRTSTADERRRLVLAAVGLLLPNTWASVHAEVLARGPAGSRQLCLGRLRLADMLQGMALALLSCGALDWGWMTQHPVPHHFQCPDSS